MFKDLKKAASEVVGRREVNDFIEVGSVAAALLTADGNIYTGISIDSACSLGFCAEHGAVAEMLKAGENKIVACVAIDGTGTPVPPCGRCRELLTQCDSSNKDTQMEVAEGKCVTLRDLLPEDWKTGQDRNY